MSVTAESPDSELIRFDIDILMAIVNAGGSPMGVDIREQIEKDSPKDINNGRLYPRLDTLAERGYLQKSEKDKRSNSYELTDRARDFLLARADALASVAEEVDR